jgi:hypothetical protein
MSSRGGANKPVVPHWARCDIRRTQIISHTMAPCVIIGERGAEILQAEHTL